MKNTKDGPGQGYRRVRDSLRALAQHRITPAQLPFLASEYRLWLRVTRNLKELEGSWAGAFRRYLRIFEGRPGPEATRARKSAAGLSKPRS